MIDSAPITWFTEDPTPILFIGGITLMALLLVVLKTGRAVILLAMAGVALCMALAVLIDYLVVTERERVEGAIYQAAAAAEHNDIEGVLQVIAPSASAVRDMVRRDVSQVKFEEVNVGGLEIQTNHEVKPPTAKAKFWVRAQFDPQKSQIPYRNFVGHVQVDFVFQDGMWLATSYQRMQ